MLEEENKSRETMFSMFKGGVDILEGQRSCLGRKKLKEGKESARWTSKEESSNTEGAQVCLRSSENFCSISRMKEIENHKLKSQR